jgi:predicted DNA-binding transcriptional regulator YafY
MTGRGTFGADLGERLDRVLGLLTSRPVWTAPELAREVGVSVRTLRRDLGRLRARGVPVDADAGRGGGLRVPARVGLGRLVLDRQETLDLLLALAVAEALSSPILLASVRAVRQKIAAAFPADERRRVSALRRRVLVGPPASSGVRAVYGVPRSAVLQPVQTAFLEMRRLEVTCDGGQGATRRLVEPHYLLSSWPAWYLVTWDLLRGAARTFRLDRIQSAVATEAVFALRPPEELMTQAGRTFRPV